MPAGGYGWTSMSTARYRSISRRQHRSAISTWWATAMWNSTAARVRALTGSWRRADSEKGHPIASAIITVFQGQGGTINDILDQTAQATSRIAERDQAIGDVVKNLNIVLDTTVKHRKEFDQTVDNFEKLITGLKNHADPLAAGTANISNAAGTVADLPAANRAVLHKELNYLQALQQPLVDQRDQLSDLLQKTPTAYNLIGRSIGLYGDWVNFYVCDVTIRWNGLQAGGPVRSVRIWQQPTGRCTPQ